MAALYPDVFTWQPFWRSSRRSSRIRTGEAPLFLFTSTRGSAVWPHYGLCLSVVQSYPTLCDPMDCSVAGFPGCHHCEGHRAHIVVGVTKSCLTLQPCGLQHIRLPCPSLFPGAYSNSCPLSRWCHPIISFSVAPFSCPHSFPASGSFAVSQLFPSGGHSMGAPASASVLPVNNQGWFPLGWTGLIFLQSKGFLGRHLLCS